MGRKLIKRRITADADAILNELPSQIEISAKLNRILQQLALEEALKLARLLYKKDNASKPGILLMSDADIDRAITLLLIRSALLYQDNKTEDLRKVALRAFELQEQRLQFEKLLEAADAIMSVSTDYIPIVGSLLRGGLYLATKDVLGYDEANKRYSPLIGATLDLATLPFGVASKSLAASYAGGMAGRYVGDKFNNPHAGQFVGTLLGQANFASANNARRFYNGYRLGQALNNSLKETKLIVKPVEHVSPFGITNGASLDVGTEGIHLSSVGSSTTPRVELFFLNEGKFPFVRTGTWTYSTNTKPVLVKDVGSFKRGYNPDFDTKVDNGITNFSYTNNFEGKGNTSYATMEPSFGLLLSKNIETPINKLELLVGKINTNKPAVTTNESLGQTILEGNYPVELDVVPIKLLDGTYSNTIIRRVPKDLISTEIDPHIIKILNTFNSDFYRHRLFNAGIVDVKKQDEIILKLVDNTKNTNFYSTSLPTKSTSAFTLYRNGKHVVVFNRTPQNPVPLAYDIHHEVGGHVAEINIPEIQKFNLSLIADWKNKLLVPYEDYKETLDYMFRVYPDGTWEGRGMLAPAIYLMKRKGLTGELILLDRYAKTDLHLDNFRAAMGDEWTANVLNKLLVLTPFIYGRNNTQRSESSKIID